MCKVVALLMILSPIFCAAQESATLTVIMKSDHGIDILLFSNSTRENKISYSRQTVGLWSDSVTGIVKGSDLNVAEFSKRLTKHLESIPIMERKASRVSKVEVAIIFQNLEEKLFDPKSVSKFVLIREDYAALSRSDPECFKVFDKPMGNPKSPLRTAACQPSLADLKNLAHTIEKK